MDARRGPYKSYRSPTSSKVMPRRTRYRRMQALSAALSNPETIWTSSQTSSFAQDNLPAFPSQSNSTDGLGQTETLGASMDDSNISDGNSTDSDAQETDEAERSGEFRPLYDGATVSVQQAVFLLLAFITVTGISYDNLQALLDIISLFLPAGSLLPRTVYMFKKLTQSSDYIKVFICPVCSSPIGEKANGTPSDDGAKCYCRLCKTHHLEQDLLKEKNFFLHLRMKRQLKFLLQDLKLGTLLRYRFTRERKKDLSDIYDGRLYRTFKNGELLKNESSISLNANTDGAPLFNSSKKSIWPLYSIINELPPEVRKRHIMLHSLWCGDKKPDFHSFLSYFTREVNDLADKGLSWIQNGKRIVSRAYLLTFGCDSPARAQLQNSKQFNGVMGCSWCTASGILDSLKKRVYPFSYPLTLRNDKETRKDAVTALQRGCIIHGIKGPSCLASVEHFDCVKGFAVDAMHCVDLGVVRQLINKIWFNPANHVQPFYLGSPGTRKKLDDALAAIRIPKEIGRSPCTLEDRAYWKASEFRCFLLHYFPVLRNILPEPYFRHFTLLSQAIFILSRPLSQVELYEASKMLRKFVEDFQSLYGLCEMSFNVHQLLHLSECVSYWGPLWCYDNYAFEGANGVLKELFNGSQSVSEQIIERIDAIQFLHLYGATAKQASPDVSSLLSRMLSSKTHTKKVWRLEDGCTLFGTPAVKELTEQYVNALLRRQEGVLPSSIAKFYQRMLYGNRVFTTHGYAKSTRRLDSIIQLIDGTLLSINDLVVINRDGNASNVVLFCHEVLHQQPPYMENQDQIALISERLGVGEIRAVLPEEITSKSCLIQIGNDLIAAHVPQM